MEFLVNKNSIKKRKPPGGQSGGFLCVIGVDRPFLELERFKLLKIYRDNMTIASLFMNPAFSGIKTGLCLPSAKVDGVSSAVLNLMGRGGSSIP